MQRKNVKTLKIAIFPQTQRQAYETATSDIQRFSSHPLFLFSDVSSSPFQDCLARDSVEMHSIGLQLLNVTLLIAALLMVARVTAGLTESNGSLPPGLWLTSPAGWLPKTYQLRNPTLSNRVWATCTFLLNVMLVARLQSVEQLLATSGERCKTIHLSGRKHGRSAEFSKR